MVGADFDAVQVDLGGPVFDVDHSDVCPVGDDLPPPGVELAGVGVPLALLVPSPDGGDVPPMAALCNWKQNSLSSATPCRSRVTVMTPLSSSARPGVCRRDPQDRVADASPKPGSSRPDRHQCHGSEVPQHPELQRSADRGELARATGLTTASITGVIDRLERAGFVHRERDASDRRRVVMHLNTQRALATVAPVFGPMMGAWQRIADRYDDEDPPADRGVLRPDGGDHPRPPGEAARAAAAGLARAPPR